LLQIKVPSSGETGNDKAYLQVCWLENISQKERKGQHFRSEKELSGKNTLKNWL